LAAAAGDATPAGAAPVLLQEHHSLLDRLSAQMERELALATGGDRGAASSLNNPPSHDPVPWTLVQSPTAAGAAGPTSSEPGQHPLCPVAGGVAGAAADLHGPRVDPELADHGARRAAIAQYASHLSASLSVRGI